MIFDAIRIDNLFSYYGQQIFDLRTPQPGQHVVLITGRNGYGKTSFLNSVKLLFTGVTESMRRGVQRQRTPSPNQYILGTGEDWWGIMNREARTEGVRDCGIQIDWHEEQGTVQVQRRWYIEDASETLKVIASFLDEPLTGEQAQHFLEARLPEDYVPFFFFDGEQIQELAEANRAVRQQHMERLLNISRLDTLGEYLNKAGNEWRKAGMDQKERTTLAELEAKLNTLEHRYAAGEQKRGDLETEIAQLEDESQDLTRKLEGMRAFVHQHDENSLTREKNRLREERDRLLKKVVETLPRDIPLLANPDLVKRTITELKIVVNSEGGIQSGLLTALKANLPKTMFDPPQPRPPLTTTQQAFYQDRLIRLLDAYIPTPDQVSDASIRIDPVAAQTLLDQMQPYAASQPLRNERAEDLRSLRDIKIRINSLGEKLTNISSLSAEEKTLYDQRKTEQQEIQTRLIELKADLRKLNMDQNQLATEIRKQEDEIAKQRKVVELSRASRRKVELADQFRNFFGAYKRALKKRKREELEDAINRHFQILMTSHQLVAHVKVGEDFDIHYQDAAGRIIGMGNLSAGTKQLAATALLWALKEVSGKPVPVIVDTPLARIDRIHQENMLRYYYPEAGHQVIVLPTDSELDEAKYRILEPHIYAQFQLHNPTGDRTQIKRSPMYPPRVKEIAHG